MEHIEHGGRSTEYGARSKEHGARSTEQGASCSGARSTCSVHGARAEYGARLRKAARSTELRSTEHGAYTSIFQCPL